VAAGFCAGLSAKRLASLNAGVYIKGNVCNANSGYGFRLSGAGSTLVSNSATNNYSGGSSYGFSDYNSNAVGPIIGGNGTLASFVHPLSNFSF
jgi:hypothetical protein